MNKSEPLKYFVKGMHCNACELFIESELIKHSNVKNAKASLKTNSVSIWSEDQILLDDLNLLIKDYGYELVEKLETRSKYNYKDLLLGFLFSSVVFGGFLLLQKLNIFDFLNPSSISYPFIFFIGIVASLSTCMAVVGSMVLSISSEYSKNSPRGAYKMLLIFHIARLIAFFVLGGIMGIIGQAFTLTPFLSFLISALLFIMMIITSLDLLNLSFLIGNIKFKLPYSINAQSLNNKYIRIGEKNLAPILLGFLTFFLPCGFTQSMQIYSLSTGDFFKGALTMAIFALGTLPVLGFISMASVKISNTAKSGLFFKTAGFLIIYFAIINLIGALTSIGLIKPIFSF